MKICFATNNNHKLQEVRNVLGDEFEIVSLKDIGCLEELPENQETLEGNAKEKAQYVYDNFQVDCFADDTGLEVVALDNAPGVYSARYAGPQRNDQDNIQQLLKNLEDKNDRSARFRTVICLIRNGNISNFTGIVNGTITEQVSGEGGFGYDPIFTPNGYLTTFANMSMQEKNVISHRGLATKKLVHHLREELNPTVK